MLGEAFGVRRGGNASVALRCSLEFPGKCISIRAGRSWERAAREGWDGSGALRSF